MDQVQRRFPHVRVLRHEQRQGTSPAKDLGARKARAATLIFADGHTRPERGAVRRLVESVEALEGRAVLTPTITGLDERRWRSTPSQIGHGYFLDLESFHCGWLPLGELRAVREGARQFYESPAAIGCVLAVDRQLYEDLWGLDPHMRFWGVEDLDFSLKCWLMGFRVLHDAEAVVAHRFRRRFESFDVPLEHFVANQLRMARKNFTQGVWNEWVDRCRQRHSGRLAEHPEGLWARIWQVFQELRPSVEEERAHLAGQRVRDEFWYAERFGLRWPRECRSRWRPRRRVSRRWPSRAPARRPWNRNPKTRMSPARKTRMHAARGTTGRRVFPVSQRARAPKKKAAATTMPAKDPFAISTANSSSVSPIFRPAASGGCCSTAASTATA